MRVIRSLAISFVMVLTLIGLPSPASAVSIYDEVISSVGSVHLSRDGSTQGSPQCASLDISGSWASILQSTAAWTNRTQIIGGATRSATLADWSTTISNGDGWAVVQQSNGSATSPNWGDPIGDAVYIVFSPSTTTYVDFSSDAIYWGSQKQAYMKNTDSGYIYSIRIQFDDLGSTGGADQCTPVISMALRDTSTTWFKELFSVAATSTKSSGGYTLQPLMVRAPIDYPDDYAGEEPPNGVVAEYVAMGDSYSSGEGVLPYEEGSDTGSNICHRSEDAYPRLLDLGSTAFVACSGAVSDYIINEYNQENVELPQAFFVSSWTETVTISIGGNDVDFGPTVADCVASTVAQDCLDALATSSALIQDPDFQEDLEDVFSGTKSLADDDTQIVVLGYPPLFPEYENVSGTCTWGSSAVAALSEGRVSGRAVTEAEFDEFWSLHEELNGVLEAAVNAVNDPDIRFIDPTLTFEDHEICGSSSDWLHDVFLHASTASLEVGSFHPNADGHVAFAGLIENLLNQP